MRRAARIDAQFEGSCPRCCHAVHVPHGCAVIVCGCAYCLHPPNRREDSHCLDCGAQVLERAAKGK